MSDPISLPFMSVPVPVDRGAGAAGGGGLERGGAGGELRHLAFVGFDEDVADAFRGGGGEQGFQQRHLGAFDVDLDQGDVVVEPGDEAGEVADLDGDGGGAGHVAFLGIERRGLGAPVGVALEVAGAVELGGALFGAGGGGDDCDVVEAVDGGVQQGQGVGIRLERVDPRAGFSHRHGEFARVGAKVDGDVVGAQAGQRGGKGALGGGLGAGVASGQLAPDMRGLQRPARGPGRGHAMSWPKHSRLPSGSRRVSSRMP